MGSSTLAQQTAIDPALYGGLHWRMLGPFRGGRVDAVSGVPAGRTSSTSAHVNGGVWKTIDAGRMWAPVFDSQPVASIGALAVAPSTPDVVYVGSGESTLRDSMGYGNGVYKSTDAGKTWTHLGLDDTHHIGKVAVDPKNPDIVFVAAIGHLYAATRTAASSARRDGGKTWEKVLFKNDNVGAVDVVDRSDELANRLRRPVEYAPPAVVHLRAVERPGRRHLQIDRRRHDLDAVDERPADRRRSAAAGSPSRRATRGGLRR